MMTPLLEKFKADFYNLVILDIKMPELDKKVKVCLLTAGEMYYRTDSDIFSYLEV